MGHYVVWLISASSIFRKMEAAGSHQTSVLVYKITWHHTPWNCSVDSHSHENCKSCTDWWCFGRGYCAKYLDLRYRKWEEGGGNCMMRSFRIFTGH